MILCKSKLHDFSCFVKKKKIWWLSHTNFNASLSQRVIEFYNYLEGFWFLLEDFLKIIFLHGEIFEFP
jgi:hypothetical protein